MGILMELDILNYNQINKKSKYIVTTLKSKKDEKDWEQLISSVFDFECNIDKNLKNEEAYSPERVFIIKVNNKVIATASAWYREIYGKENGYLHMVAVDEKYRGKGLSYLVVDAAIQFMIKENKKKIILKTDEFREAAIGLYNKIGFCIKEKV